MLPELGTLRGTATLSADAPVARFTLNVQESETLWSHTETIVAPGGRWTATNVLPGRLKISATNDEGASAVAQVELAPGQTLDVPLQLRLLQAEGAKP
jgi:hypothetical protein